MTGKDLIIYILQHDLEDEEVFKDGKFSIFITEEELAVIFGVGTATIRTMYACGLIKGFKIGDSIYFLRNTINPMKNLE